MEWSVDWLTLSMKPVKGTEYTSEENYGKALNVLRSVMCLDELFNILVPKGKCRFYAERLEYNDVNIKLASPEDFNAQGLCIELSGNGLRYFMEYLSSYGYTLRQWCGMWRALAVRGQWVTKCTRFDVAMDDKVHDGARPTLTMRKVLTAICDDELSCKARVWSDDCNDLVSFKRNYKARGGQGFWGTTVNIGNRKSDTYIRFYDKLIEQKQKGETLSENLTSWVRCEFEYHAENAMSVFNAFLDYSGVELGHRICGYALNYIRFVDRIASNISRCPVKRWWREFLNGCTKRYSLPRIVPVRSALSKSVRWFKTQLVATLATFKAIMGADGLIDFLDSCTEELAAKKNDVLKTEIINNYKDRNRAYEEFSGFMRYNYTSDLSDEQLTARIENDRREYYQQFYNIVRAPEEWGSGQKRVGALAYGL